MGKKLTDILPKISQWESIPYAPKVCGYGVAERILKHFNIK